MSFQLASHVLKHKRTTLERADKFISPIYFTDVNLRGRLFPKTAQLTALQHYAAPGRIPYCEAVKGNYKQANVGDTFGPTWSTHWFQLDINIPESWVGEEVCLVWNSDSEAMVWIEGQPIQGLTPENKRELFCVSKKVTKDNLRHSLYIEMACNGLFGAGVGTQIAPPDLNKYFTLSKAHITVIDRDVYQLLLDIEILIDLVKHLPKESQRGYQALYTVNEMVNIATDGSKASYARSMEIAKKFFSQKNGETQHTVCAVGNCHIDSAWLWSYDETIRKCGRSWSTAIRLLETYPQFTFAASQAQQFEWVKQHYPGLYSQIEHHVKEGRFIPVGGTWIEMDGNIPSGEGFIRQFLYGQRYFEKEFGMRCKEFWLPDTFGYSAQLPQIMQLCGIQRFVTQKLSWSLVNKFPHHTFWWKGIDGSSVLTHFPPGDSYGMEGKVDEVIRTANNSCEKGRSNHSLYLYGWGDGGQGPSEEIIERLVRLKDVDGCPKVEFTTPEEFFVTIEKHESDNLCTWVGELYLELHNGTYTSQAKTKMHNRQCEFLLHDVEFINSLAWILNLGTDTAVAYPSEEILRLWKLLLLNQFHDVLPGTSIEEVYKDAMKHYRDVNKSGGKLFHEGVRSVLQKEPRNEKAVTVVNTLSWPRREVISLPSNMHDDGSPVSKKKKSGETVQADLDYMGNDLVFVSTPSCGYGILKEEKPACPVKIYKDMSDDLIYMENEHIKAAIDSAGRVVELYKCGVDKNVIPSGCYGNQFVLFDDVPLYWDAWDVMDYHMETRKAIDDVIEQARILDEGNLRVSVKVSLKISDKSYLTQLIILDMDSAYLKFKTEVTWHECHKFLKVELPVNILSMQTTYEIQYGHLQRPVHQNTSWDWARFEVCGHKWADLSEHDWGVAVLNDCKYGYSTIGNVIRLSLLRSPKSPDPRADMGTHDFTYAFMPHTGTFQDAAVIQAAYSLNCPLRIQSIDFGSNLPATSEYFTVDTPAIILHTIKKSEDHDALIIRLYEAYGSRTQATITTTLPLSTAHICNALEDILGDAVDIEDGHFQLSFTPFQIVTVMLKP